MRRSLDGSRAQLLSRDADGARLADDRGTSSVHPRIGRTADRPDRVVQRAGTGSALAHESPLGHCCATSKQRARVRKALEQLRTHLVQRGPTRIDPSRTDDAAAGIADEDAQALAEMLQVLASSRNRDQAVLLGHIDRALRELDTDPEDFGLCEECEEEIDPRRLAIIPYAGKCAACQAKAEPIVNRTPRTLQHCRFAAERSTLTSGTFQVDQLRGKPRPGVPSALT